MAQDDGVPSDEEIDAMISDAVFRPGAVDKARRDLRNQTAQQIRHIRDQLEQHKVMTDNPDAKPPRIVCTTCPAVVKVHFWKLAGVSARHGEIWVECHGEHIFGSLNLDNNVYQSGGSDLLLRHIHRYDDKHVDSLFNTAERQIQDLAAKAAIYQAFLLKKPPT